MGLFKYIERYQRIDNLIKLQCTGTPVEFAEKLGISESHLYFSLREMKDLGLPIVYNRDRQTYSYKENVRLEIHVGIQDLSGNEKIMIAGGVFVGPTRIFTSLFYNQSGAH